MVETVMAISMTVLLAFIFWAVLSDGHTNEDVYLEVVALRKQVTYYSCLADAENEDERASCEALREELVNGTSLGD